MDEFNNELKDRENKVYDALRGMGVVFEAISHPPVFTCEEANKFIEDFDAVRTKSLFLRNRKGDKHYLVVLDDKKTLDIKSLGETIGDRNLSFASPERLMKYLGLVSGAVSLFGLINDANHEVRVFIDADIFASESVSFHPNVNTVTVIISVADMARFIDNMGHNWEKIKI